MALKDIIFRIKANTKNAEKNMKKLGDSTKKLGAGFGKLGALMGVTLGAKFLIDSFVEQEKAITQLETVLKSTGGAAGVTSQEMQDLAKSLQSVTKFSDEAIIGAENILLTFTQIGSEVLPSAVETVLDMAEALGVDLKGQAIQLGKALNDPIRGVGALQEVGVSLTQSQKELINSLVAVGDTAGAQKVILNELSVEFGNSARAAGDTFGGKLSGLENTISDTAADLISVLVPALESVVTIAEIAATAVGLLVDGIKFIFASADDLTLAEKVAKLPIEDLERLFAESEKFRKWWDEIGSKKLPDIQLGVPEDIRIDLTPVDIRESFSALSAEMEQAGSVIDANTSIINNQRVEWDNYSSNLQDVTEFFSNTTEEVENLGNEITTTTETTKTMKTNVRNIAMEMGFLRDIARETAEALGLVKLDVDPVDTRRIAMESGLIQPFEPSREKFMGMQGEDEDPLSESELRDKFKEFDIIAEASAQTFKETFSGILGDLFGDNSILQKLLSKTFGGFLEQMASSLSSSIFSGLLSLLPGGSILGSLFGGGAGGAQPAGNRAGGDIIIPISIGDEPLETLMVQQVPNAMNRAARLRMV